MSKNCKPVSVMFVFVISLFLCGMADISMTDIETAVIEKDFAKAEKLAQTLLARQPQSNQINDAKYYLGLSQLYLGDYPEAGRTFQQILDNRPSKKWYDKASLGVIDSLLMTGDYAKALKKTEKLLRASRRSEFLSLIYLKTARAHLKLAHWKEARKYLDKIRSQFPNSLEAHTAQQLLEEKQYFAVQVGSFINRDWAVDLADEIKQKGEYAYIVETTDKKGRVFYRVRIGQFSRLDHAQDLKQRLTKLGYPALIYP